MLKFYPLSFLFVKNFGLSVLPDLKFEKISNYESKILNKNYKKILFPLEIISSVCYNIADIGQKCKNARSTYEYTALLA